MFDSAVAFWQGFYPPSTASNATLANGSMIVSPLGGYQYILIDALLPSNDVSMEGTISLPYHLSRTDRLIGKKKKKKVGPIAGAGQTEQLISIHPIITMPKPTQAPRF